MKYLPMLIVLLLTNVLVAAESPQELQKLQVSLVQLQQDTKLSSTELMDGEQVRARSSFWPQCKIWFGLCAITIASQIVGHSLRDREIKAAAQEHLSNLQKLESVIRGLERRVTDLEADREDDQDEPVSNALGQQRPSADSDFKGD
jgi:hypothetical protein